MQATRRPKFLGKAAPLLKPHGLGLATLAALGLAALPQAARAQGFQGPYDPSNFTAAGSAGDGIGDQFSANPSITPASGPTPSVQFSYSASGSGHGIQASADFKTVAAGTGLVTFDYSYSGYNAYFFAHSDALVEDYTTGTSVDLGADGSTGSESLKVNQGDTFGFHLDGGNVDSDSRSNNDLTVTNFDAPAATPAPEPSSVAAFAFTGLGAVGLMLRARKRRGAA